LNVNQWPLIASPLEFVIVVLVVPFWTKKPCPYDFDVRSRSSTTVLVAPSVTRKADIFR
jgi:hypothetical protein